MPTPGVPPVSVEDLRALIIPAAGIAIVTFTDGVLTARAFAARRGQEVEAAELRGRGLQHRRRADTRFSGSSSSSMPPSPTSSVAALYSLIALGLVVIVMVFARVGCWPCFDRRSSRRFGGICRYT